MATDETDKAKIKPKSHDGFAIVHAEDYRQAVNGLINTVHRYLTKERASMGVGTQIADRIPLAPSTNNKPYSIYSSKSLVLTIVSSMILLSAAVCDAEGFVSAEYGISMDMPDNWTKRKPTKPWTLVVYANLTSGENVNINVLDRSGVKSIKDLSVEKLFHPQYENISIAAKSYFKVGKTDLLKVIYALKDGPFKQSVEGDVRMKYMAILTIHKSKQITITFTDSERNFERNLETFNRVVGSIEISK